MITITADNKTPRTTTPYSFFLFSFFFFSQSQRHSHKEQFSLPTSVRRCSMWMVSIRNPVFPLSCLWCSIFEVSYVPNILFWTLACSTCDFSRGKFSSFSSRKASCGRTSLPSLISPRILDQNFVKTTWLSGKCFLAAVGSLITSTRLSHMGLQFFVASKGLDTQSAWLPWEL